MFFYKCILFSKQNTTVFWDEIATNGRKIYFHLDETLVRNKYIEEEITQAASLQDTSLTTTEANLHIVPSENQSEKKEKNNKKKNYGSRTKKQKLPNKKSLTSCHKFNLI